MSSDILCNSLLSKKCHVVRCALAGLDQILSQQTYFFFSRMCSLRLKGEVEIIPLNYLSVPENVFQEVCWGFSCRIAIDYFSGVRCFSW